MLVVGRADQHEVGGSSAHLGASHHQTEMGRLDMLAACLQAVVHGRGQAGLIAAQTGLDAAGHFFVHGRPHSSGKKGFWIKSRESRVGLRFRRN
jgi:hypothetical protein